MRAKKLTTEKEIKKYIREVFMRGNGKEITATLKKYYAWKKNKREEEQISAAKQVFGIEK